MLRDQDGAVGGLNFGDDLRRLPLQRGHEFSSHRVTLKYHSLLSKEELFNPRLRLALFELLAERGELFA